MIYIAFIAVYMVALVGVGLIRSRKVENQEDFAVAGRSLSTFVLFGTMVATWIGTGSIFGQTVYLTGKYFTGEPLFVEKDNLGRPIGHRANGTYFLMARTDGHRRKGEDDVGFCRRLLVDHGIATIPTSVFHSAEHAHHVHGMARFAFCKTDAVLQAAAEKLGKLPT